MKVLGFGFAIVACALVAWLARTTATAPDTAPDVGKHAAAQPRRGSERRSQADDAALRAMLGELLRTPVAVQDALADLESRATSSPAASDPPLASTAPTPPVTPIEGLILLERVPNLARVDGLEGALLRGDWPNGERQFEARQKLAPDGTWRLNGPWRSWYPSGTPEELGAYRDDLEHGEWSWWYADGATMARGQFEDGERTGAWTFWHPNGVVIAQGAYENGERSGFWAFRRADGSPHPDFTGHYAGGVRLP